ncbi:MAG: alpha/beta hydrolase [Chthoniobacterales bacterium]
MSIEVSCESEDATFFPAGQDQLFGVLTSPVLHARGIALIMLAGGATLSFDVNRWPVRLCRRAAALGLHAFRFDYHGFGESAGNTERFDLAYPFVRDAQAAMDWLEGLGLNRFVLVGSCFGARTALSAAQHRGVVAVALVSPPIRDFEMGERSVIRLTSELSLPAYVRRAVQPRILRGLIHGQGRRYRKIAWERLRKVGGFRSHLQAESWRSRYEVSRNFLEPLSILTQRKTPLLFIFGSDDDLLEEFDRAFPSHTGLGLREAENVAVVELPGEVHGFKSIAVQDAVVECLSSWIDSPIFELTGAGGSGLEDGKA